MASLILRNGIVLSVFTPPNTKRFERQPQLVSACQKGGQWQTPRQILLHAALCLLLSLTHPDESALPVLAMPVILSKPRMTDLKLRKLEAIL